MKKVSFDFDSTLDKRDVQRFAKQCVGMGHEVWIVTSRIHERDGSPAWNDDLYEVASIVGIKKDNIHFTAYQDKIEFLKDKDFTFHLDDDEFELIAIMKSKDKCRPINVDFMSWELECRKLLK